MEYRIEFLYSPRFAHSVAKTFWLRDYGMSYFVYIGVPLLTFGLCFTSREITSSRAGGIFLGFLLGVTATIGLQFLYQFFSFEKATSAATQKWNGVKLIFKFDEYGIVAESELGSGSYTWKMVNNPSMRIIARLGMVISPLCWGQSSVVMWGASVLALVPSQVNQPTERQVTGSSAGVSVVQPER